MKLVSLKIDTNLPDGLGSLGNIRCEAPDHKMRGWRVSVRGPAVFLISPPGWAADVPPPRRDPKGPSQVFEIARAACVLRWEGELGIVDNMQKYDGPPMHTLLEQAEMLERATAPQVPAVAGGKR
jgi:hypothetical protein